MGYVFARHIRIVDADIIGIYNPSFELVLKVKEAFVMGSGASGTGFFVAPNESDVASRQFGWNNAGAFHIWASNNNNIDLKTAGTGKVKFGVHTALGGESLSGYITILDLAGVTRKLAVIS